MFLLDTNAVSELRRVPSGRADPSVVAWFRATATELIYLSVISLMEMEIGIGRIERRDPSQGRRMRQWLDRDVLPSFEGRLLSVDIRVARRCAALHVPDPRPERDALIAATALVHGYAVVTRNTSDFAARGVQLINPWDYAA